MNKKRIIKLAIPSILIVVAFGIALHANIIKLPIERQIHIQLAFDPSDDRVLVGASHNVFVGKVIRQISNKNTEVGPITQFELEIIHNIKGNFNGRMVIDQQGGYIDGILYTIYGGDVLIPDNNNGDTLLNPGSTYLLASRSDKEQQWHVIISDSHARKLISKDKNASASELEFLAKNDERVIQLQEAYKNEIPLDADIQK